MEVLAVTKSLCPRCLRVLEARVIEKDGLVHIAKECPEHGPFEAPHPWSDPRHYRAMARLFEGKSGEGSVPAGLVVNLNNRCNQDCPYCFARANESPGVEPSLEEIRTTVAGFPGPLVYLSGGEATLREDLFAIIREVRRQGRRAALFSNGKKLADPSYVRQLKECGLDLVILQFDTLDEEQCLRLRGERLVATKLAALRNLKEARIAVYLFAMVVEGVNDDQIGRLLALAAANDDCVRILNFNPVWELGRRGEHEPTDVSRLLKTIERRTELTGDDFLEGTAFCKHVFEILGMLTRREVATHPWCEMRTYALRRGDGLLPLGRLFDIKKMNRSLERIIDVLKDGRPRRLLLLPLLVPCGVLLKALLNPLFLRSCLIVAADAVRRLCAGKSSPLFGGRLVSLIAGTFHTAENVDLRMTESCNLFSDMPGGEPRPSCLRQIAVLHSPSK